MQNPLRYLFIAGFCAVVLAGTYGSSLLPAGAGLLMFFLIVTVLVIRQDLHIFYLVCAGIPATFVVASVSLLFGCFAALLLLGTMAASTGETDTRPGKISFGLFSLIILALSIPVLRISHVMPWLIVLAVFVFIAIFLLLIGEYRIKIRYRGEKS
jgi:hypothetical protein